MMMQMGTDSTTNDAPTSQEKAADPLFRQVWKAHKQITKRNQHASYLRNLAPRPEDLTTSTSHSATTATTPSCLEEDESLMHVIDFANLRPGIDPVERVNINTTLPCNGMVHKDVEAWSVKGCPGFVFFSSVLSVEEEAQWLVTCALDYVPDKNVAHTNLERLWPDHCGRKLFHPIPRDTEEEHVKEQTLERHRMRKNLHWATLGYHFDWTERSYSAQRCSPMPERLVQLAQDVAGAAGYTIIPETGIVNFYGPTANMGAHKDDAELAPDAPVVSLSLGCPAIFLLGGDTLDDRPVAVYVRGGDAMLLADEMRHVIHGVPCAFPGISREGVKKALFNALHTHEMPRSDNPHAVDNDDGNNKNINKDNFNDKIINCTRSNNNTHETPQSDNHDDVEVPSVYSSNDKEASSSSSIGSSAVAQIAFTYLENTRVNINVRQVFVPGQEATEASNPEWYNNFRALGMGKAQ